MVQRGTLLFTPDGELDAYQESAAENVVDLLIDERASLSSGDEDEIHVRPANPEDDLDVNTETVDDAIVDADSPIFEAETGNGEEDDWYGYYALDTDEKLDDKTAVLWGFQFLDTDETAECDIAALRVKTKTGGTIDQLDLTGIEAADGRVLLYNDPLYVKNQRTYLEAFVEDGGAESTIPLKPLITVAEEAGDTLEPSGRFASSY